MILCLMSIIWYWNIRGNSVKILIENKKKFQSNLKLNYNILICKFNYKDGRLLQIYSYFFKDFSMH